MRNFICAAAAAVCLLFTAAAHADQIYNFNLTQTSGTFGNGSGSFEVNTAPTGAKTDYLSQPANTTGINVLEDLSFTIDGQSFDLDDATSHYGVLEFVQSAGVQTVDDIAYSGTEDEMGVTLTFNLLTGDLGYTLTDMNTGANSKGKITDVVLANVAATPEPSSLALLGTGLLAGCAVLRRRFV